MTYLIAIDDGHGMETSGKRTPLFSDGHIIHEDQFNSATAKYFAQEMQKCGCNTVFTAPSDVDTSLADRVKVANDRKADIFVSFHYNASSSQWQDFKGGIETWYYRNSERSKRLAECVQNELVKGTPQVNRGIKEGGLYVNRYTTMPSILIEAGFMNLLKEANLMLDVNFQKEVARETAQGVCKYLNIPYVEEVVVEVPKVEVKPTPQPQVDKPTIREIQHIFNRVLETKLVEDNIYGSHTQSVAEKCTIKLNSRGEIVKWIQRKLNSLGFNCGKVDGDFGEKTLKAVKLFQQVYLGIGGADGIIGKNTWRLLLTK